MLGVATVALVRLALRNPAVDPSTPVAQPADLSVRATFLGGSLIDGLGASDRESSFPMQAAELLGQRIDEVVAADPDIVVVLGGRADVEQHSLQ